MTTPIPGDDPKGTKTVCIVAVISSRKADFVEAAVRGLRATDRGDTPGHIRDKEMALFQRRLVHKVAALNPQLFITQGERDKHVLNLGTRLEDIDLDEIWGQLESLAEGSTTQ
jgi:hypothetical protein